MSLYYRSVQKSDSVIMRIVIINAQKISVIGSNYKNKFVEVIDAPKAINTSFIDRKD